LAALAIAVTLLTTLTRLLSLLILALTLAITLTLAILLTTLTREWLPLLVLSIAIVVLILCHVILLWLHVEPTKRGHLGSGRSLQLAEIAIVKILLSRRADSAGATSALLVHALAFTLLFFSAGNLAVASG
jgi:hypothetical protein